MRTIRYALGRFPPSSPDPPRYVRLVRAGFTGNDHEGHGRRSPMRVMMRERLMVRWSAERSWLIRVMWLIRCTIGPQISHEARINHVKVKAIVLVSELSYS